MSGSDAIHIFEGYRIGFYSNERDEPPHVHVIRADNEAKFWLDPVRLANNMGVIKEGLEKSPL